MGTCVLTGTSFVTLLLKNYYIIYLPAFYFLPSNKVKKQFGILVFLYSCIKKLPALKFGWATSCSDRLSWFFLYFCNKCQDSTFEWVIFRIASYQFLIHSSFCDYHVTSFNVTQPMDYKNIVRGHKNSSFVYTVTLPV